MKQIILISGAKQAGKSSVLNAIKKAVGESNVTSVSFSYPIKNAAASMMLAAGMSPGLVHESLFGDEKELSRKQLDGRSGRDMMTSIGDAFDESLFGRIGAVSAAEAETDYVVIDDLRFPIEQLIVSRLAAPTTGVSVWSIRNGEVEDVADTSHRTEQHWPEIRRKADMIVDNNGTLEDLQDTVDGLLGVKTGDCNE